MKNFRAVVMLVISIIIGLAAAIMAGGWVAQQAALASNKIVVAAVDIDLGSQINPHMIKVVDWPAASIPRGAISDAQSLQDRVVKTTVLRGEPVLETKLAPVGTKGGLSAVIAEGKRAITVRVNEVIGVAGFALPGNYVDVLVNTQDQAEKPISKIVLENILVLAVAQEASRDETKPKVVNAVTLEVSPVEAEKLDLARSIGNLSLVLRNQLDKDAIASAGMRKADLLRIAETPPPAPKGEPKVESKPVKRVIVRKPPVAKPAEPQKDQVEIIRGIQKSAVEI